MAAIRLRLICFLVLSLAIVLCPAAPLDNADEDDSKTSPDWPIQDTEQYEFNPLQDEAKRARLTGISPFDLMGKRDDDEFMKRRARLTGISPFDLMGKRDSDEFMKRARLTGISPFDLMGKRDSDEFKRRLTGIGPFDLMGKTAGPAVKRRKLTGISPFDLMGKRADDLEAYKRRRLTGISPFDLMGKRQAGVASKMPSLPLFDLPNLMNLKIGRVTDDSSYYY